MGNTIMVIIALLTIGIFIGTTFAVSMESVFLLCVIINKIFNKMDEFIKFFIVFLPFFPLVFILTFYLNLMAATAFVSETDGYVIILRMIAVIILDLVILIPLFRKLKKINNCNEKEKEN